MPPWFAKKLEKHLGDRKVFLLDSSEVAEYLEVWRPLKDGKNRPLFLDERQDEEANRIRLVRIRAASVPEITRFSVDPRIGARLEGFVVLLSIINCPK